jgi:hypothetical protein
MRRALLALTIPALFGWNIAFAQMATTTPSIGATSPLGTTTSTVGPTGIPLGSTELSTPGVSPLDSGAFGTQPGMTTTTTTSPCSMMAAPTTPVSGSTSVYDGGGITTGTMGATTGTTMGTPTTTTMGTSMGAVTSGTPTVPGTSGPCGSTTTASSATSTTPLTTGGAARTGIPLGSYEIGSAGVSPMTTVTAPNSLAGTSSVDSTMAAPTQPTIAPVGAPTMIAPPTVSTTPTTVGCAIGGMSENPGC